MVKRLLGAAAIAAALIFPAISQAQTALEFDSSHTGSGLTLSTTNTTDDTVDVTGSTGSSGSQTYSTASIGSTSDKLYFEGTCNANSSNQAWGIASVYVSSGNWLGSNSTSLGFYGGGSPSAYVNGSSLGSWSGCAAGDTVGIAFDTTTGNIYIRDYHSGSWGSTWNNTTEAQPTSGGYSVGSGLNGGASVYVAVNAQNSGEGGVMCGIAACAVGGGSGLPTGYSWFGGSSGTQSFSSVSISGSTFTPGTASNVGTFSAVLSPSSPAFSGTWSLVTSGSFGGTSCYANGSSYFSITSGDILHVSSSAPAGTYNVCYEATQSGVTGSPYENIVAVTGGVAQCGSSVTPAVSGGLYVLQCQLSADLTINNPTGMNANGGDSFLFELQQPSTEPGTPYTVTLGTAYNQIGSPSPNNLSGLSSTANYVDDVFAVDLPTFANVWTSQRVEVGATLNNMGN
jgi:hypothetical protein